MHRSNGSGLAFWVAGVYLRRVWGASQHAVNNSNNAAAVVFKFWGQREYKRWRAPNRGLVDVRDGGGLPF